MYAVGSLWHSENAYWGLKCVVCIDTKIITNFHKWNINCIKSCVFQSFEKSFEDGFKNKITLRRTDSRCFRNLNWKVWTGAGVWLILRLGILPDFLTNTLLGIAHGFLTNTPISWTRPPSGSFNLQPVPKSQGTKNIQLRDIMHKKSMYGCILQTNVMKQIEEIKWILLMQLLHHITIMLKVTSFIKRYNPDPVCGNNCVCF